MKALARKALLIVLLFISQARQMQAQDARLNAKIDATQIMVGDQARVFLELQHNAKQSRVVWATIPDTFNTLEVVEKGKIDTVKQGELVIYKQRLLVTGFDSGSYAVPGFTFTAIPNNGTPYTLQSDSFRLLVQTVAVDTTKPFKPIKGIMQTKSTWLDYIWYIIGGLVFLILAAFVIYYFTRNKKTPMPLVKPAAPPETAQEKALRLLGELEEQKLWQNDQIKEYYTRLTDILRDYIEERFHTKAMELTTDELLYKARTHREMVQYYEQLATTLSTADLAKFAKAEPMPYEHINAMDAVKQFVIATKPVITETPTGQS